MMPRRQVSNMAFAYTIDKSTVEGRYRKLQGRFTNGAGDTGGDVKTGLAIVKEFRILETGAAVAGDRSVVNETFTADGHVGGDITIVTTAGVDGNWEAIGEY